ncbi:hypothetical protein [Kosakonia sacchari]|uniref:Uncharacterized protein n=1 Tax=Kosakonia sacchari TaxID=1158459 RepID=A0A1G4YD51_9ENTR|nr:hypothetical protein [Kosakonia sacchari]AHJ75991.1 hypothetical protein C813_15675 [Kosakonia sacchari SP1]SCX51304.1 hypothetical protein SAMN02927897_02435 [Kosakonia sacchari]
MKINPLPPTIISTSVENGQNPVIEKRNRREIPTGSLYTGPQNNNDDRPVRPDARSLVFTPDSRGEGYPAVEKQIAGQIIRQREGQTSESGFTASYGAPYEARKSLLAYGLAAAGIHDPASLPDGGRTQTTALLDKVREQYAASPQAHYDALGNTRTPSILVAAARDFFDQQINIGAQYKTNTHDDVPGLEGKALAQYSDRDKVQSLRHFARQPLRTEQNEPTNAELVMKDIGALLVLDGIAAEVGAMAEFFTEKAVTTEGRSALATLRNTSEQATADVTMAGATSTAAEVAVTGEARGVMAGETTAAAESTAAGETGSAAAVNRLRPSLAGDISQYAVKDGEALLKESRASVGGIHQVKDAAGNDRWLLRYREGAGENKVYEVGQDFRPGEGRARIIDPQTRQPVLTVHSGNGEWQRSALPGGVKLHTNTEPQTSLAASAGTSGGSALSSARQEKFSPVSEELRELYMRPDEGQYRARTPKERAADEKILLNLNSVKNRQESGILAEYIEGGDGTYRTINNHLRHISPSAEGETLATELKAAVSKLNNYDAPAYRAATIPAGTYGTKIKVNDVVTDTGFMSASALPQNSIKWLETWTGQFKMQSTENVLFILDKTTPKKMAAGGMLSDHILVTPNTPLKVKEIHVLEGNASRDPITIVRLKDAEHPFRHDIKNIFSGNIELPAVDVPFLKKLGMRH